VNDEAQPRPDTGDAPYSTPSHGGETLAPPPPYAAPPPFWRRPRAIGIGVVVIVVVVAAAAITARMRAPSGAATAASDEAAPLVTVRAPGRSSVNTLISFTGGIVARYDQPIGVEGEGGRVSEVLVESGDHVHRGQVLARLDPTVINAQVANLKAALEQSRAEAVLAEADYARASAVANSVGALSKEEVDKRRSVVATTAAKVKAAEAQLTESEARLGRTDIRAPADGIVLTRTAEVGQTVLAGGATLFRLARGGEIEMRALAAETDLPKLKAGQPVDVYLTGIPTGFKGKVRLVSAVIDPATRLGEVRVSLPQHPDLRPGAFARGDVQVGSAMLPIVPQTAVLADGAKNFVFIVDQDRKVVRRTVKIAGTQPQGIVVSDGLDGTEPVVSSAGAFLHEGEKVRIADAKGTP
jgi:RND family efflux transporter MFP subunit